MHFRLYFDTEIFVLFAPNNKLPGKTKKIAENIVKGLLLICNFVSRPLAQKSVHFTEWTHRLHTGASCVQQGKVC